MKKSTGRLFVDVVDIVRTEFGGSGICFFRLWHAQTYTRSGCNFPNLSALFGSHLFDLSDLHFTDLVDRQHTFYHQTLRDDRLEFVVNDVNGIDFAFDVATDDRFGDLSGFGKISLAQNAEMLAGNLHLARPAFARLGSIGITPLEEIAPFASYGFHVDVLICLRQQEARSRFEDVGVECAGKSLVARNHDQSDVLLFAMQQQRMIDLAGGFVVNIRARHQRLQYIDQHLRVRTRCQGTLLRLAQLCRRNHLHGLGDLPRVFHAADTPPDVENVCHLD